MGEQSVTANERVVVDTDVLIDVGRGDQRAVTYLETLGNRATLAISAITQMELLVGCANKHEQQALAHFLDRFEILLLTEAATAKAITLLETYRLSHGLLIADALIAATAITYSAPLVSKNQRDYRFIKELHLLPYPPQG